jgi:DeoR/GlpR family transcriptional regulator of sugar metabolism
MTSEANATEDNLLRAQRHQRILGLLKASGQVHAAVLGGLFGVSAYTIRRDLDELADSGWLKRVHGGAVLASSVPRTFDGRSGQGLAEKAQSAAAALTLLEPDQVVIVDGGSTGALLVDALPPNYPATFVTHSPAIASALIARTPGEVVLLGGRVDPSSRAAVGGTTVEAYGRLSADLCLLGTWGVNLTQGVVSPYYEEALVRSAMVGAANLVVGLAVSEKLGTGGPYTVAPISALTHLSVEADVAHEITWPFEDAGVKILRPVAS